MAAAACDAGASTVPSPYQGVVELDQRTLAFEVGGRVVAMNVARGQAVKKGQVIATLDDTLALSARAARAAELDAAKAQLALLESGARPEDVKALEAQVRALTASEKTAATLLARQRDLTAQKVAPEASLDELSGRVKATRAQREAAEHQLASMRSGARTPELDAARARVTAATVALAAEDQKIEKLTLRAPIDGTILEALSDLGEVVGPGTPVATLGDVNHPYVDVFVATKDIAPLGVGQAGHILIDGVETLKARVEHIADTTEFTPRYVFSARERPHLVVRVRLRVEDPAHHVHAGLPAFATFEGMPVAVQP
ncbi:MAG: HlyD family efflux transporter periplasmic adaptor subunit [Myxococcota bacterium]